MFSSVFSRIGVIFIVLVVGAWARWRKVLTRESTDGICRIAIELTLPFLYFYTLATGFNRQLLFSALVLPLFAVALTMLSCLITWLVARTLKLNFNQRNTFLFLGTFANYGFLAIPIVFALLGEQGLVRIIVFNIGITFVYWTLGVAILTGFQSKGSALVKNLANNAVLALLLGLIVGITSFSVPQFILEAARLIGAATIPLALIVIGSILADSRTSSAFSLRVIFSLVFCRLLLIPALVLVLINLFQGLPPLLRVIIVLQAAMPSASTAPILVKRFGGDLELAANGVFFTTLFSIITVPLFISLALR